MLSSGDRVPPFEARDVNGQPVILSELLKEGPVVLVLVRGFL